MNKSAALTSSYPKWSEIESLNKDRLPINLSFRIDLCIADIPIEKELKILAHQNYIDKLLEILTLSLSEEGVASKDKQSYISAEMTRINTYVTILRKN